MDLRQLETFYWVSELGSFSAAAAHLHTTQPAVSARIRQLEHSLGVILFEGNTRRMRLTVQGRELVPQIDDILARLAKIRENIGAQTAIRGTVRIGAIDTVAMSWLPQLIALVGIKFPGVRLELLVGLGVDLREQLEHGDLDVAFLTSPLQSSSMLRWPVGRLVMRWMASPKLKISRSKATPKNLADATIISHTRGSELYSRTEIWFREGNVEPPRFHECSSLAVMIRLAIGEVGVALLPSSLMNKEVAEGELRLLPQGPVVPDSEIYASCSPRRVSPVVTEIVRLGIELANANPAYRPLKSGDPKK